MLKLVGPVQVVKGVPFDEKNDEKNSQFILDLGAGPQPGQSWVVDQTPEAVESSSIFLAPTWKQGISADRVAAVKAT